MVKLVFDAADTYRRIGGNGGQYQTEGILDWTSGAVIQDAHLQLS